MIFNLKTAGFLLFAACAIGACSDSTSTTSNPTVQLSAEMTGSSVARSMKDGSAQIQGGGVTCDSLRITRVRILVSRLKLHLPDKDTVTGDKEIKAGPLLLVAEPGKSIVFASGTVPSGTYEQVKFEFHRFSDSEIPTYLNDTNFSVFVTGERNTFVVEGFVYPKGVATPVPFTYYSKATANLALKFPSNVTINSATTFAVQIDPLVIFKKAAAVLDPRDPNNSSDIDNAIKDAVKSLKK